MLNAAGHEYVVEIHGDLFRGEADGLLARAAHPVELDPTHLVAPASDHRREPADVAPYLSTGVTHL